MKARGVKTQGAKHHSCAKGTPVTLKLHDGRVIAGRFKESTPHYVRLEDGTQYHFADIRRFIAQPGEARRMKRPRR